MSIIAAVVNGTIGYFVKRGWDKILSEEDYRDELNHIISKTIDEYANIRPVEGTHDTFPFYQSQAILNELVKLGIADKNDDSEKRIETELAKNEHIIPPKQGDLRLFLDLFYANCTKSEKIKLLHIEAFYKEEVFIISQKIDRLQNSVDKITTVITEGLKAEWKRQLEVYKGEIAHCKPKTALDLLDKLEEAIKESEAELAPQVMAKLHHLKALCYEMMRDKTYVKEYHESYVLDSTNIQYMEREAIRLFYRGNINRARELAMSIKEHDEDNPVAAFVGCYDDDREVFSNQLRALPPYITKSSTLLSNVFQYIAKGKTIDQKDPLISFVKENYQQRGEVGGGFAQIMDNHRRLEYVQFVFLMTTPGFFFDKRMEAPPIIEEIAALSSVLATQMKGTEMENLFPETYFFDAFTKYACGGDKALLLEAVKYCDRKKENYCMMLAVSLQYEGYIEEALDIIGGCESEQTHFLKMHIYNKKGDRAKALAEYGLYMKSLPRVDVITFKKIFNGLINKIIYPDESESIDLEDLAEKPYENDNHRQIVIDIKECVASPNKENYKKLCEDVADENVGIKTGVAFLALNTGHYQLALPIYESIVQRGVYDGNMFYYMQALHLSKTHNALLLELLKEWRLNADHQEVRLLEIELQLRTTLREWEESLDVVRTLYGIVPLTENLYATYLFILAKNKRYDEIAGLKDLAPSISFTSDAYIHNTATALFEAGFLSDAMNFLLPYAQNKEKPALRMLYLTLSNATNEKETVFKQYEEVKEGVYVYYILNGIEQDDPLYMKPGSNSRIINSLMGHKSGEKVLVEKEFGNAYDTVEIKEIVNHHYALLKGIYAEMKNPIASNLPTTMFQLPETGGVEALNDFLVKTFASQEEKRRKAVKECLDKYKAGEMPYGMVPVFLYEGDFIRGYYILCSNDHGILLNPTCRQESIPDDPTIEYVLDYSSLMLFYELTRADGLTFKHQFVVSKVVEEIAERELEKLEKSPDESLSMNISLEGVEPIIQTKESKQWAMGLFRGLLEWIRQNCKIETAEGRLDLLMSHDNNVELPDAYSLDYVADYTKLVETKNRILISDDKLLQQMYLPRQQGISSHTYLKHHFDEDFINRKMLSMYYIGVPVGADFVYEEFMKKQGGKDNVYDQALKGWCYLESLNTGFVTSELGKLARLIYLAPVVATDIHREIQKAFATVLQGERDVKTFFMLQRSLSSEFKLLGNKLAMVLKDLLLALEVLGNGMNGVII